VAAAPSCAFISSEHVQYSRTLTQIKEPPNMDVIMIAIGVVFFALALAYVRACENL